MNTVTFYRHSSLGAKLGVNPASHARHAYWWLRAARGQEPMPDWADKREAMRQARGSLRMARWCQRQRRARGGTR